MHFDKTLIHTNNLNLYKLSQKIEINTCNMRLLFPIQETIPIPVTTTCLIFETSIII